MNGKAAANVSIRHIEFLDYVRGIAILGVFFFHGLQDAFHFSSLPWGGWQRLYSVPKTFFLVLPASFGWAGVSIFFVVSGFCIHLSFCQQGRDWRSFFIRRFFRIYPPYLLALILYAVLFATTNLNVAIGLFPGSVGWREFLTHLFLVHNFDPQSYWTINPAFWSIAVEIQLYLLYPVLLLMVGKFGWRGTMVVVAVCELFIDGVNGVSNGVMGAQELFGIQPPNFFSEMASLNHWFAISPLGYWFSWSIGAWIANALLEKQTLPLAKSSLRLWTILILLCYFVRPLNPFSFVLFALLTGTAISRVISGDFPKIKIPKFCLNGLRQTGLWSYSMYLLHQPLLAIGLFDLTVFFPNSDNYPLLRFLSSVVFLVAIAGLSRFWFQFFELPSIALGKRLCANIRKSL